MQMKKTGVPPQSSPSVSRRGLLMTGLAALVGCAIAGPADAQRVRRRMRRMRRIQRRAIRRMRRRGGVPDQARAAIRRGDIRPLRDVVAMVRRRSNDAEILDVDLHQSQGRWVYGVRVLTAKGRVRDVFVDGRTLEVLSLNPRGDGDGVPLPENWTPRVTPHGNTNRDRGAPQPAPDAIPPPVRRP